LFVKIKKISVPALFGTLIAFWIKILGLVKKEED